MGGCAMLGQSLINISNGARARLSGIVAAVMLLVFIMFGSSLIELVPMAALTGLMIMVAIGTFEWASLKTLNKMPKSDIFGDGIGDFGDYHSSQFGFSCDSRCDHCCFGFCLG